MNAPAIEKQWRRARRSDAHAQGLCRYRDNENERWLYGVLTAVDYREYERPYVVRVGAVQDCWRYCEVQA